MGFVGVLSRLGAVAAPFVVEAKRIHQTVPFGIMGALAVTAALMCLILPETRGKPTLETIEHEQKKGSTPIFLYFDLYFNTASAAHTHYIYCIYIYIDKFSDRNYR